MILQEKRIFCDTKEPDKNHLWLRPRLDKEGFDLLYFGSNGWTPLIDREALVYRPEVIPQPMPTIPGVSGTPCGCIQSKPINNK